MIDYMGFRAMAIGFVMIDDTQDQLRLGYRPGRNGTYFMAKKIDDLILQLRNVGIVLNLKENRFHQAVT